MDTTHWGWVIIGTMTLGNFWIAISVILNCLKKLDRCETKLMAMTEAYPHQAMIAMQREGMDLQREVLQSSHSAPSVQAQPWQTQEAS